VETYREYQRMHVTGNAVGEATEATPFLERMLVAIDSMKDDARLRSDQANIRREESERDI
jgi:hypothetical protein